MSTRAMARMYSGGGGYSGGGNDDSPGLLTKLLGKDSYDPAGITVSPEGLVSTKPAQGKSGFLGGWSRNKASDETALMQQIAAQLQMQQVMQKQQQEAMIKQLYTQARIDFAKTHNIAPEQITPELDAQLAANATLQAQMQFSAMNRPEAQKTLNLGQDIKNTGLDINNAVKVVPSGSMLSMPRIPGLEIDYPQNRSNIEQEEVAGRNQIGAIRAGGEETRSTEGVKGFENRKTIGAEGNEYRLSLGKHGEENRKTIGTKGDTDIKVANNQAINDRLLADLQSDLTIKVGAAAAKNAVDAIRASSEARINEGNAGTLNRQGITATDGSLGVWDRMVNQQKTGNIVAEDALRGNALASPGTKDAYIQGLQASMRKDAVDNFAKLQTQVGPNSAIISHNPTTFAPDRITTGPTLQQSSELVGGFDVKNKDGTVQHMGGTPKTVNSFNPPTSMPAIAPTPEEIQALRDAYRTNGAPGLSLGLTNAPSGVTTKTNPQPTVTTTPQQPNNQNDLLRQMLLDIQNSINPVHKFLMGDTNKYNRINEEVKRRYGGTN